MTFSKALRVVVHARHYTVVSGNGQTLLTSEQYFDKASAKRAARRFIEAINQAPMKLEYWDEANGKLTWVSETVRPPVLTLVGDAVAGG